MLLPVKSANLAMLTLVADRLGDLCNEVVFVGGCATALLISDPATPDVRQTFDVDCIIDVISLKQYGQVEKKLRDKGLGRRARINARDLEEQQNTCSCTALIIACIIYWQAREIDRIVEEYGHELTEDHLKMLGHISPIECENIILN